HLRRDGQRHRQQHGLGDRPVVGGAVRGRLRTAAVAGQLPDADPRPQEPAEHPPGALRPDLPRPADRLVARGLVPRLAGGTRILREKRRLETRSPRAIARGLGMKIYRLPPSGGVPNNKRFRGPPFFSTGRINSSTNAKLLRASRAAVVPARAKLATPLVIIVRHEAVAIGLAVGLLAGFRLARGHGPVQFGG